MKTIYNKLWMLALLMATNLSFTACTDEDDEIGYQITGHWFGDMDMYYYNEKAMGSELQFEHNGWGLDNGTGYEVDYYRRGTITNYFNWRVINRVLYLTFENPELDCMIINYVLTYDYFRGYLSSPHTGEPICYFSLYNYDREWDRYGYEEYRYPYGYYAKEQAAQTDSLWNDSPTRSADSTTYGSRGIRGINMVK